MKIMILSEKEIRECVRLDRDVISAIEDGFTQLYREKALVPPIMQILVLEHSGEVDVKAAYIQGLDSFAVKIASGFHENHKMGLSNSSGMMLLISAETGHPKAVLLDNGYLTQVRTGAAGAIAARYLSREDATRAGVIGAGSQARYQMAALKLVRNIRTLRVYSLYPEDSRRYAEEMASRLEIEVIVADSAEEVVRHSDIVVTATPAKSPVIRADWLHPGLHITAMGADAPDKQELFPEVFARADLLACDRRSQCFRLGELHHPLAAGIIRENADIPELGAFTSGARSGRTQREQITICDLTGVGVQDTEIALLAYRRAADKGLGMSFES